MLENDESCTQPASCINCIENNKENTNHSPNSKICPIFLREKEIQAIITLEKVNKRTAVKKYYERNTSTTQNFASVIKRSENNLSPSTTIKTTKQTTDNNIKNSMPPPTTSFLTRNIKDYNDIMKITDISEDDTTSLSSQSSETQTLTSGNKINILPRNTPKRQRNLIKKQAEANKTSKRTKKD